MEDYKKAFEKVCNKPVVEGFSLEAIEEREFNQACFSALNKQVARQPYDVEPFAGLLIGLCPICHDGVNSEHAYCGKCGQLIDWGFKVDD